MKGLILTVALIFLVAFISGCSKRAEPITLEARALEIERSIMCPICRGQTIADSQSALSLQMKSIVREKVAQGATREEILQFFVERYGEGVLASPPKRGFNLLLWVLPFLILGAGGFFAFLIIKSMKNKALTSQTNPKTLSEKERQYWESRLLEEINKKTK